MTLPLAPLSAAAYFVCEWLFFITKPSSVAALPLTERVMVLLRSPLPLFVPRAIVQAVASLASLAWYPRTRAIAIVPAAVGLGALSFVLVDNFTYTIFGFGSLTAWGGVGVVVYAALLPLLIVGAGWNLMAWTIAAAGWRRAAPAGVVLALMFVLAPATMMRPVRAEADTSAPPDAGGQRARSGQLPNILFLGIDGIDAPTMSAYGYPRQTTPFLERLREDSLFFENAFANVGRTHGSLVTLLTGRLPFSMHVTFPPTILRGDDAHRHLPALLKPLGYTTLQLGMRHYADAEDANLLGFDAANYRWQRIEDVRASSGATDESDVFRAAIAERLAERAARLLGHRDAIDGFAHVQGQKETPYWSDDRRVATLVRYFETASEPWFVHAHLLDTHCCNDRPFAWCTRRCCRC